MRIRRLTLTLPSRLRPIAERDARLIAQAVAEKLGPDTPSKVELQIDGHGAQGHGLASMVGARLGALGLGRR